VSKSRASGRRLGTKRNDRRWEDGDGNVFASELEAVIFASIKADARVRVRRCSAEEGDTFNYRTPINSGVCNGCGLRDVVQERTYTPDLFVYREGSGHDGRGVYLEVKGYFPADKRNLLRHFVKTGPSIDLRIVLQRDAKATRNSRLTEYIAKYLKVPVCVWNGKLPDAWIKELK